MTVLCSGGPSGLKVGSPEAAYVTGSEIATLIAGVFDIPAWIAIAAYAAAQSIALDALCATDPPAMPTFTLVDITTILGTTPFLGTDSYAKLNDLIAIAAWHTFCRCTTVTTPPAPAAPTYPVGAPQTQPPLIAPQMQTPCFNVSEGVTNWGFGTAPLRRLPDADAGCTAGPGDIVNKQCLPATAFQFAVDVGNDGTTNGNVGILVDFYDSSHTLLGATNYGPWAPGTFGHKTPIIVPPASWASAVVSATNDNANVGQSATVTSSIWCDGTSPFTPQSDCCPPDPTLQAKIEQILQAVEAIYQALPVQLASLAQSTVHGPFTTSGHFTTGVGTIGVKVGFTAGTAIGEAAGDPNTFFEAGWITTSMVEGNYKSRRIAHSPELILFDPLVDTVHYTPGPGVTLTLTELTKGP